MSYLNDYLKVIPKADASKIRDNIAKNKAVFEVNAFSEAEFERLILQLAEQEQQVTTLVDIGTKVTADPLNDFYSHVVMDLSHLIPEQNAIEQAGENYDKIYQGHLEELKKEIEALERRVVELKELKKGEDGLILRSFSFEPDKQGESLETYTEDTAYLFADRDGTVLAPAQIERFYHTYYLALAKNNETNVLQTTAGISSAQLEILYESPNTLDNTNENYGIEKAIDGDSNTFWFNVALKPNNAQDTVFVSPKGRMI